LFPSIRKGILKDILIKDFPMRHQSETGRQSLALRLVWLLFVLGLVGTALPAARNAAPATAAPAIDVKTVEALIAERIQAGDLVGVSLAAARDGKLLLSGGYGRARIDDGRAVTADTLFAVGSVTKQFTAACILLLAEDGKLALTDKVAKYYPDLTRAADITILDLLNHVSGYPDYYPLDFVDRRMAKPMAVDDVIRAYATGALDFEPGSRYSYSNTGFLILGRIVERVSGEAFGAFLSRRILSPLGMKHTIYEPEAKGPAFAEGHTTFALSAPMIASHEGKGWIAMAGALYSTASDLVRWDLGLHGGKVLKPESYKLMITRRRLSDGTFSNYACGLGIGERNGVPVISHNGAVSGFYAFNLAVPSTGSALAILINFEAGGQVNKIVRLIMPALLPPAPPAMPAEAAPAPAPKPSVLEKTNVPAIAGPAAGDEAKRMFLALQAGAVDRTALGGEYNWFLTNEKIKGASARLKSYGAPTAVTVTMTGERGGMEVSTSELKFASGTLTTLMYRTPDGKVQQFFVSKN
jgi:CubicO group peptidase (beta-lactamase class C family)